MGQSARLRPQANNSDGWYKTPKLHPKILVYGRGYRARARQGTEEVDSNRSYLEGRIAREPGESRV